MMRGWVLCVLLCLAATAAADGEWLWTNRADGARRRAARPQPSAAEVQRFMADFERMRTERIRASRAT